MQLHSENLLYAVSFFLCVSLLFRHLGRMVVRVICFHDIVVMETKLTCSVFMKNKELGTFILKKKNII